MSGSRDFAKGVVRWSDRVLDGTVAGLASWTAVFHLARWMEISRDGALGLWMVVLFAWAIIRCRRLAGEPHFVAAPTDADSASRPLVLGLIAAAVVVAWIDVDGLWWPVLWAGLAMALLAALRSSLPRHGAFRGRAEVITDRPSARGLPATGILILALAMALLSLVMVRPDQDDVFVVNRSTWIAEHDSVFPERDTVFSDDFLPVQRPAGLPSSVEALVGSIAAWVGVAASSLTYLGLAPLVAALGVLAIWRLLRGFGARAPALATWVATIFLVLDGAEHGSFGNFSAGRSWQGKSVFLVLVVPMLWHHAGAWGRTGRYRHLRGTTLGVVAGLGLTSTAVLVTPAVVVVAVVATAVHTSVRSDRRRRLGWGLATTFPALIVGCGTLLADAQRLGDLVETASSKAVAAFDPLRWLDSGTEPIEMVRMVFGSGPGALVALVASLLAWTAVDDRPTRLLLLAGPVAVFGIFLAPGVLDVLNELGEADAIAWRALWILPLPALVGLLLTERWPATVLAPFFAVAVLVFLAVSGTAITSSDNRGTELVWPPTIDLPRPEIDGARGLIERTPEGGRVAGPEDVDFAVSVLTTRVSSTNPRSAYLRGRHVDMAFRAGDRRVLSHALESGWAEWGIEAVSDALDELRPDAVCLRRGNPVGDGGEVADALIAAGYQTDGSDEACQYFVLAFPES